MLGGITMNFYNFYTGQIFDAYNYLGAHIEKKGVTFRTFAPAASNVAVIGSFNNWQPQNMNRVTDDRQFFELFVENAKLGDMYKFQITASNGIIDHCDPYGFGMELRPDSASIIRDLDEYKFSDAKWLKKRTDFKKAPLNIYEVHLGSWLTNPDDEHGWFTYDEIAPKLIKYMKENGYNCLELMPISEHPCDESWGYQNTGFFAPTSRYGTATQFQKMIDLFHASDIAVIVDFVPVHFAVDAYALANYDGTALYEYPHNDVGVSEWGSCNFMHSRGEVRSFLNSAAAYWLDKYHIDGLRMDAISRILYWQGDENRGVNGNAVDFVKTLNSGLKDRFPNCMLAAEDSTNFKDVTKSVRDGGLGFDYKWDMGWMNDTLEYMKLDPLFRGGSYHKLTFSMMYYYDANFLLPFSHDETVHGKCTILQKMFGEYEMKFPQGRLLYMYMMTHPGKKLNFMGNEIGQLREWDEKREQDWDILKYPIHDSFHKYIQKLNKIYIDNPALWEEDYDENGFEWIDCHSESECLYSYIRRSPKQNIVVALNFSGVAQNYTLDLKKNGKYRVLLNSDYDIYGGNTPVSRKQLSTVSKKLNLELPAFSGIILEEV